MRFDLVSIFPDMFAGPLAAGVLGRARDRALVDVRVHDLRDYADPPRRTVDDEPFGGGAGMVFRVEPLWRAVSAIRRAGERVAVVLPAPAGEVLGQPLVRELAGYGQLIVLCDRYEGADARVRSFVTHEISLGDFVLSGGDLVALVLVDAVARTVPGVVGAGESVEQDSFGAGLLDWASYTRPARYRGMSVPEVVVSGHHRRVGEWRRRDALRRTLERRPDLLEGAPLGAADRALLRELRAARVGQSVASRSAAWLATPRPEPGHHR